MQCTNSSFSRVSAGFRIYRRMARIADARPIKHADEISCKIFEAMTVRWEPKAFPECTLPCDNGAASTFWHGTLWSQIKSQIFGNGEIEPHYQKITRTPKRFYVARPHSILEWNRSAYNYALAGAREEKVPLRTRDEAQGKESDDDCPVICEVRAAPDPDFDKYMGTSFIFPKAGGPGGKSGLPICRVYEVTQEAAEIYREWQTQQDTKPISDEGRMAAIGAAIRYIFRM